MDQGGVSRHFAMTRLSCTLPANPARLWLSVRAYKLRAALAAARTCSLTSLQLRL
jgi:hypothetical protein